MKITMYRSADGQLHENAASCNLQNSRLAASENLKCFLLEFAAPILEVAESPIGVDAVHEFMVSNHCQILDLLEPMRAPRPRKIRPSKADVEAAAKAAIAGAQDSNRDKSLTT